MRLPHLTPTEKSLFVAGLVLVAGLGAELLYAWLVSPPLARGMAAGLSAEILTGREGGVPVAIEAGVPLPIVMQLSMTQDLAGAFLVYPWFLHMLHVKHDSNAWIMRKLRAIEERAGRHETAVRRFGIVGVFVFMLLPFLVNGPLVALMLGRLASIPTRFLLAPVILATAVGAAAWTYAFDAMLGFANAFHPRLGMFLAVGLAVLLGVLGLVDLLRDRGVKIKRE